MIDDFPGSEPDVITPPKRSSDLLGSSLVAGMASCNDAGGVPILLVSLGPRLGGCWSTNRLHINAVAVGAVLRVIIHLIQRGGGIGQLEEFLGQ